MTPSPLQLEIESLQGPIAIFGAGGFIGTNLLKAVLQVRPDCYGITHEPFVPWRLADVDPAHIRYADVRDRGALETLCQRIQFRTIFSLAAYGGYSEQTDTQRIYETNLVGLSNILHACDKGLAALVHAGSSSEYGLNSKAPQETADLRPNSDYAVSKVAGSYLLRFAGEQLHKPVLQLRFYSVYGPWEEPHRLIPQLVIKGLAGKYPPFVDPEISRDFVFVDDAVEALVLAAGRGVSKVPGASINIASGQKTTIRELAAAAQEMFQIHDAPAWKTMPNRSWDLRDWVGNPERAQAILGWSARTSLKDGLRKTTEWMKEQSTATYAAMRSPALPTDKISAVIACYRDEQAIPIMYERLRRAFQDMHVDYEIIFVNDASPDTTNTVLSTICSEDKRVIAIEHSRNFGSQSAFLSGMEIATGHAVVLLDGDLQDPPELIPQFYARWKEGYDVVYGQRVDRQAKPLQKVFYKLFYRLFRAMANIQIPLDAGDFSLIDRRVVRELLALPETDQFVRGLRAWVGFRQSAIDYVRPERRFGVTTNNFLKNFWWARKGIFSFSYVPLELLMGVGAALTFLSFLALVAQIGYRLWYGHVPPGLTTIIVLILFFGGVQLLALSILGEYIGKVLEETKHRPKFIRKAIRVGSTLITSPDEILRFTESRHHERRA